MGAETYAVVSYLPGELGEFVNRLRARVDPCFAKAVSHVTVLPPRELQGSAEEKLDMLRQKCASIEPFDVSIEGVSTFWPVSGVVYLAFSTGYSDLVSLHNALNINGMEFQEPFEFTPHVTIAQDLDEKVTHRMLEINASDWKQFRGESTFRVNSLVLVRQRQENQWVDIGPVPLSNFSMQTRR